MLVSPSAEEMATWPTPNYVDPVTRRPLVLGIQIPLIVMVLLFSSMRFYRYLSPISSHERQSTIHYYIAFIFFLAVLRRIFIVNAMGVDDYFMIGATVTFCANSIVMCISTLPKFATGYHLWDIPPAIMEDQGPTGMMGMSAQLMFVIITSLTKVSILCTYLRIFPSDHNRWFCFTMLAFTAAWGIGSFCLALFQCTPIRAYWLPAIYPNAKCLSVLAIFYTTGFLNVASDFLIFLWPAKDLAKIQISFKQRVMLIAMFCFGVVICIAGVCRLWYTPVYVHSYDKLWNGAVLYAIVSIETSIGIICGCLPACKPIMAKLCSRFFTSTHSSTNNKSKKPSRVDGQSFPFQSLNGGIVKTKGYSVSYEDVTGGEGSRSYVGASTLRASTVKSSRKDPDNISSGSEEWIMLQDDPTVVEGVKGKSPV